MVISREKSGHFCALTFKARHLPYQSIFHHILRFTENFSIKKMSNLFPFLYITSYTPFSFPSPFPFLSLLFAFLFLPKQNISPSSFIPAILAFKGHRTFHSPFLLRLLLDLLFCLYICIKNIIILSQFKLILERNHLFLVEFHLGFLS